MNYENEIKQIEVMNIETDKQAMAVIHMLENTVMKFTKDLKSEVEKITNEQIQPLKNQISKLDNKYNQGRDELLRYLKSKNQEKVYAPAIKRMAYIKNTERVIVDDVDLIPIKYIKKTAKKKEIKDSGKNIKGTHLEKHESVVVCVSKKDGQE